MRTTTAAKLFLSTVVTNAIVAAGRDGVGAETERLYLQIINRSNATIEVYRVHDSETREFTSIIGPVMDGTPGAIIEVASTKNMLGYQYFYEIYESSSDNNVNVAESCVLENLSSDSCLNSNNDRAPCRRVDFGIQTNALQQVVTTLDQNFNIKVDYGSGKIKAFPNDGLQNDQQPATEKRGKEEQELGDAQTNSFISGIAEMEEDIGRLKEQLEFEINLRKRLAIKLEEYACKDIDLETSLPIYNSTWRDPGFSAMIEGGSNTMDDGIIDIQILHEQPSTQIHVLKNFISEEECNEVLLRIREERWRSGKLDGRKLDLEIRKAMQQQIRIPWEKKDHIITKLGQRLYNYTNHVLNLNIQERGQEPLNLIRYVGRENGSDSLPPDHYSSHCDGHCDGGPHKKGDRVATMLMYCEVPEEGGHTNFQNLGVHIKPKQGDAVFFTYIDPDTLTRDPDRYHAHSGCPVHKGNKTVVTQWFREGADFSRYYTQLKHWSTVNP